MPRKKDPPRPERGGDGEDVVRLFDLAASSDDGGAAAALTALCLRQGLTVEAIARSYRRTPEEVLGDIAWMEDLMAKDVEVRKAFQRVVRSAQAGPNREHRLARPGRNVRTRRLFGSSPARTDAKGRLRIPASFAALHPDGGWLAMADAASATVLPRPAASNVAMGIPLGRKRKPAPGRSVELGPEWAGTDVVVLGNAESLRVVRAADLRRNGLGRPPLRAGTSLGSNGAVQISTGLFGLDDALGNGLYTGEVATLGALPGTGSSTLSLQVALGIARRGERVAWIGSHLDPLAVRLRMETILARVGLLRLASGAGLSEAEAVRLRRARSFLERAPLLVACGARSTADLLLLLRSAAAHGAGVAVVDNVVFPPGQARRGYARLRTVAAEARIAVLLTTRVSRKASPFALKVRDVRAFAAASEGGSSVVLAHRPVLYDSELDGGTGVDDVVLLGTHGQGRLRFARNDGPCFLEARRKRVPTF